MENLDIQNDNGWKEIENTHRRGKIMGGLLVVAIGTLFLARELGADIPAWVFSWKTLLIGIGLVSAIKHKFFHPAWIILVGVGGTFLLGDIYPELNIKPIMWPIVIILAGLFIMFKPRRKHNERMRKHFAQWHRYKHHNRRACQVDLNQPGQDLKEDYVESTAFMAGVKKNIISKNFKGGEITNIFGGTELNLMQADIDGKAKLELTQVFGGVKLIIPANWEIKSELVTVFGSVEDKRPLVTVTGIGQEPAKLLLLTGDTFFGGIEISSY